MRLALLPYYQWNEFRETIGQKYDPLILSFVRGLLNWKKFENAFEKVSLLSSIALKDLMKVVRTIKTSDITQKPKATWKKPLIRVKFCTSGAFASAHESMSNANQNPDLI